MDKTERKNLLELRVIATIREAASRDIDLTHLLSQGIVLRSAALMNMRLSDKLPISFRYLVSREGGSISYGCGLGQWRAGGVRDT